MKKKKEKKIRNVRKKYDFVDLSQRFEMFVARRYNPSGINLDEKRGTMKNKKNKKKEDLQGKRQEKRE